MSRDNLARLISRNPVPTNLRERAAALRLTAARRGRITVPAILRQEAAPQLPAANSDEARAMFAEACREDTRLSRSAVQDFADLKRTPLEWWTKESLERAVETGELTPTAAAPLYVLAARRELMLDEAAVACNVGALHLLAYAEDFPHPAPEAASTGTDGDPIFDLIARHIKARDDFGVAATEDDPAARRAAGLDIGSEALAEAKRRWDACDQADRSAWAHVIAGQPTTRAGFDAWVAHIERIQSLHDSSYSDADEIIEALRENNLRRVLARAETPADPIFAAIKAERFAWEAANAPGLGEDEVQRLSEAHAGPWETMLATKPTTLGGLLALVRTFRGGSGQHHGPDAVADFLDIIGDHLSRLMGPQDDPAAALVDAIEREWAIYAREEQADEGDSSDEAEARSLPRLQRRQALLMAAERVPATTRAGRHAKALAEAWVQWVEQEKPGQPREHYVPVERFAFDIHRALLRLDPTPTTEPDPIFAAIAECRAAQAEHSRLYAICGDLPDEAPEWAPERQAHALYWRHWKDRVTKIVPTTREGVRALAQFVGEFEEREGGLNQDETRRLFANIAAGSVL